MSTDLLAIAVGSAVTAGLCAFGPAVIRRLPEPLPPEAAKIPYRDLGSGRLLASKLALVGAVVGGLVGWRLGATAVVGAWVYLVAVGVVLGYIDARTWLLPTRIIAPSYLVLSGSLVVAASLDGETQPLLRAGLGWLAMGGFYFLMWLVYPAGLGYGDVRLAGLLGLALGYLGWAELVAGMYAGLALGALGGVLLAVAKEVEGRRYPFGPFMLLGALAGLLWGPGLAGWYTAG